MKYLLFLSMLPSVCHAAAQHDILLNPVIEALLHIKPIARSFQRTNIDNIITCLYLKTPENNAYTQAYTILCTMHGTEIAQHPYFEPCFNIHKSLKRLEEDCQYIIMMCKQDLIKLEQALNPNH